jgi:hypothetical protein
MTVICFLEKLSPDCFHVVPLSSVVLSQLEFLLEDDNTCCLQDHEMQILVIRFSVYVAIMLRNSKHINTTLEAFCNLQF